jgi:tetratricopeptide (TPR) repeat protein
MNWKNALAAGLGTCLLAAGAMVVAAPMALAQGAHSPPAAPSVELVPNSNPLRATAPGGPRNYDDFESALLAADLDQVISRARRDGIENQTDAIIATLMVMDEIAAKRPANARAMTRAISGQFRGGVAGLTEAWVLLAEGRTAEAVTSAQDNINSLPGRLGAVRLALIFEATGQLDRAAQTYADIEARSDTRKPSETEPRDLEEVMQRLMASQTTQILYRAALVQHRLGKTDDAARLYALVEQFAPTSPDTLTNIARLKSRRPPLEPALDMQRALGRWALFLSEEFGRTDGVSQVISGEDPPDGLGSTSASMLSQFGVALDPQAHDWLLGAAYDLYGADGLDGAVRIVARIPSNSVYAPDAELLRAEVALKRNDDRAAAQAAQRAARLSRDRWGVALSAASVLTRTGDEREAMRAYARALSLAPKDEDRADVLISRAAAEHFYGRLDAALADARAAIRLDPSENVRMAAMGYMKDHPEGWTEAVRMGRELLAGQPDSVSRLNQLGYTLLFRPETLEEGFRLLTRGVELGPRDYAVIDSLGWAYYLYGDFEEALRLIKRADDLSDQPNAEILDHLGDVYWRLGQQESAREAWRKALAARPEAMRRQDLTSKIANGMTTPAPQRRTPPTVSPQVERERTET